MSLSCTKMNHQVRLLYKLMLSGEYRVIFNDVMQTNTPFVVVLLEHKQTNNTFSFGLCPKIDIWGEKE